MILRRDQRLVRKERGPINTNHSAFRSRYTRELRLHGSATSTQTQMPITTRAVITAAYPKPRWGLPQRHHVQITVAPLARFEVLEGL